MREPNPRSPPAPSWKRRAFSIVLAVVAIGFVAWIVPIRDRCEDPLSPATTRVAVTRVRANDTCVLHVRSGDVVISAGDCAALRCEAGLASTLSHARLGWVASLLAAYVAATLVWAMRWRLLLALGGIRGTVFDVWRVVTEAQAAGILLPGGVGGDALRIASVVRWGAPTSIVVASVLLDRALGLVTLAVVALLAIVLGSGGGVGAADGAGSPMGHAHTAQLTIGFLAAIPVGFVVVLAALRTRRVASLALVSRGRIGAAARPVLEYLAHPDAAGAILRGAGVSMLSTASQFLVLRGLVHALGGAPVDERWIIVGIAMAMIVTAMPLLPGGWGTADATYVFFFGLAGLTPAVALGVCLLYRAFWYVLAAIGAGLQLVWGARGGPSAPPARGDNR